MDKLAEWITTGLDLVGLLALAVGLGFAASLIVGPASIAVSGVILLLGSRVILWVTVPNSAPRWWQRMRRGGSRP